MPLRLADKRTRPLTVWLPFLSVVLLITTYMLFHFQNLTFKAVFTPCVSLCDAVFKECPSDYDSKVISPCNTLPSSIWFDEPCNSGTGGPCF